MRCRSGLVDPEVVTVVVPDALVGASSVVVTDPPSTLSGPPTLPGEVLIIGVAQQKAI
jgi:hypothetical protein